MAATGSLVQAVVGGGKRSPEEGKPDTGYPVFSGSSAKEGHDAGVSPPHRELAKPLPVYKASDDRPRQDAGLDPAAAARCGSTSRPEADWCEELLAGLATVPVSERGRECARRREEIGEAVAQLDRVLNESEEVVKLKPSKNDKLTAGSYHAVFRHLHWALDRCRQLQEAAASLEDYDSDRLVPGSPVSLEYALLGADIVERHDYASRLLSLLCGPAEPQQQQFKQKAEAEEPETLPNRLSVWLTMVVAACGRRECMRGEMTGSSECPPPRVGAKA